MKEKIKSFIYKMFFADKIKGIIKENTSPIDAVKAQMIAITGQSISPEKRYKEYIHSINNSIATKVKFQEFYYTVILPVDLISKREDIINDFKERGFIIYTLKPDNKESFIISWKYE